MNHFTDKEISCHCGCGQKLNLFTVHCLETTRKDIGDLPILISSPSRCQKHNCRTSGASPISLHMWDIAVDIKGIGDYRTWNEHGRQAVKDLLNSSSINWYIIEESRWIHADLRNYFKFIMEIRGKYECGRMD